MMTVISLKGKSVPLPKFIVPARASEQNALRENSETEVLSVDETS